MLEFKSFTIQLMQQRLVELARLEGWMGAQLAGALLASGLEYSTADYPALRQARLMLRHAVGALGQAGEEQAGWASQLDGVAAEVHTVISKGRIGSEAIVQGWIARLRDPKEVKAEAEAAEAAAAAARLCARDSQHRRLARSQHAHGPAAHTDAAAGTRHPK